MKTNWRKLILWATAIGLLDLCAASLSSGRSLFEIAQSVASGWYGAKSADMGSVSAIVGTISQVLMAWLIAAIFAKAAELRPDLVRRPLLAGIAYGVVIFLVMAYLVLPLSAVGHPMHFRSNLSLAVHFATMIAFGLAVAFATKSAAKHA